MPKQRKTLPDSAIPLADGLVYFWPGGRPAYEGYIYFMQTESIFYEKYVFNMLNINNVYFILSCNNHNFAFTNQRTGRTFSFCADFGPFDLGMTMRYLKRFKPLLQVHGLISSCFYLLTIIIIIIFNTTPNSFMPHYRISLLLALFAYYYVKAV